MSTDALAPPLSDDLEAVAVKPKAKRKKTTSPTMRSLAYMRDQGCIVQKTEHWNPFARKTNDLFGFIDIVALHPNGDTIGVQTTTGDHVANRIDKITNECAAELAALRKCGWKLVVHGWRKLADGRYHVREVDVS